MIANKRVNLLLKNKTLVHQPNNSNRNPNNSSNKSLNSNHKSHSSNSSKTNQANNNNKSLNKATKVVHKKVERTRNTRRETRTRIRTKVELTDYQRSKTLIRVFIDSSYLIKIKFNFTHSFQIYYKLLSKVTILSHF